MCIRDRLYNLPIVCTHTHFHDNNYFCSFCRERGILYDKRLCEKRNTSEFYEASIMYYSLLKFDEMENEIGDNSERTSSCVQPNIIRTNMNGEGNWFSCLLNSTWYHLWVCLEYDYIKRKLFHYQIFLAILLTLYTTNYK